MNRLAYICLFFTLLVVSCNPDDDEAVKTDLCGTGTLESLNCTLSVTSWRLEAVTSDIPRTAADGSESSDWMRFRTDCDDEVLLSFSDFTEGDVGGTPVLEDSVLTRIRLAGGTSSCRSDGFGFLFTNDYLETAEATINDRFAGYLYGDEQSFTGGLATEVWYDIEYTDKLFSYSVAKEIDGVRYQVSTKFIRVVQ